MRAGGGGTVAVRTPMPGCTGAMVEWWFGHVETTEDYLPWHPEDHVSSAWRGERRTGKYRPLWPAAPRRDQRGGPKTPAQTLFRRNEHARNLFARALCQAHQGGIVMLVKRFQDAETYEAPNHWGVTGHRLQGFEDGGPENQWVGFSPS